MMNKKEKLIELLKFTQDFMDDDLSEYIKLVESGIFDVPSEDEIDKKIENITSANWKAGYFSGINFILNYKKPESDGK